MLLTSIRRLIKSFKQNRLDCPDKNSDQFIELLSSDISSGDEKNFCQQENFEQKSIRYDVEFIAFKIPRYLEAKQIYGVWICLKNTSSFTWLANEPSGQNINLFIQIDNYVVKTVPLGQDRINPGEKVEIHALLPVPDLSGSHQLTVDLVKQHVTKFSDQGAIPLRLDINVSPASNDSAQAWIDNAKKINPWFYRPTGGINRSQNGQSLPVLVSKAQGCYLWDTSGRRYIDYVMGWGCSLLGYADQRVQSAIQEVLFTGAVTPFPYVLEMEIAQLLVEDFPSAEMVVFGKNGSDVCTIAARVARTYTGKSTILYSGYHGWQDFWAERMGFQATGIPERPQPLIYGFQFNDLDDFNRLYQIHKHDLAAIMIEPAGPAQSIQGHFQDADTHFLATLKESAHSVGALLIFDEIVTGYRYPTGSVQKATGIIPDLTCLGKAIAAGMPLSALVGAASILRSSMSHVYYGPTFKSELYSFAAAKAAIQIYRTEPVADFIWDYGQRLSQGINRLCQDLEIDAKCWGPSFRLGIVFNESDPQRLRLIRTLYVQELLQAGITTYNGIMLPSYAHTDEVLDMTLTGIKFALEKVKIAIEDNSISQYLEIPLL